MNSETDSFFVIKPKKGKEVLDKVERVAVHASDLDGLVSAALILMMKPNVKVDFLTLSDVNKATDVYDLVIDLPKIGNAVNIDHHWTNYNRLVREGRLTGEDLVDPDAPSAALLVAKYFGLEGIGRVDELVDLATRADTGNYDEVIYLYDKVIKCNSKDPGALMKIAWALVKYGVDAISEDEWIKSEIERLSGAIELCEKISRKVIDYSIRKGYKLLVLIVKNGVPRICIGDLMHNFMRAGGDVVVLLNMMREKDKYCPSLTENMGKKQIRISIRSKKGVFDARIFLERFGGGGHPVAAGARIYPELLDEFLWSVIDNLSELGPLVIYFVTGDEIGA